MCANYQMYPDIFSHLHFFFFRTKALPFTFHINVNGPFTQKEKIIVGKSFEKQACSNFHCFFVYFHVLHSFMFCTKNKTGLFWIWVIFIWILDPKGLRHVADVCTSPLPQHSGKLRKKIACTDKAHGIIKLC